MKRVARIGACLTLLMHAAGLSAQGVTLPSVERVELDNGVVVLLNEKSDVPLIAVELLISGGSAADPEGLDGMAALFAEMLAQGAGQRDAAQFAEAVDSVGGLLEARADLEYVAISAEFLARDADLMVELLADMLLRPTLDAAAFDKVRERTINVIRAAKDSNLNALLPIYARGFLFAGHPYGNPVSGSESSLAAIEHSNLLDYYDSEVGADRLIVSVSGDFDVATLRESISNAFGAWRPAAQPPDDIASRRPERGRRVLLIDKPGATQTYFWIGNVGVARDFDARAALDIADTVFGGRFTSLLNTELRIESGLTYGAYSELLRPRRPGSIAIVSSTRTETTVEAIDKALGILAGLHAEGLDDAMLESAKNYVLGQFPTRLETASQLAAQLASLEFYGLSDRYINDYGAAILAADDASVNAVIAEVFPQPEDLVFVLLGDAAAIREAAAGYGPLTEASINGPQFRLFPDAEALEDSAE